MTSLRGHSPRPSDLLVVGLAGKAGSGFDTDVARILADEDFAIVRADEAVDSAWGVAYVIEEVARVFGKDAIFENTSDPDPCKWVRKRGVLGEIVSSDPELLTRLNAILYPCMMTSIYREIREHVQTGRKRLALTATRLVNADLKLLCHYNWYTQREAARRRAALLDSYRRRQFDESYIQSKVDHIMSIQHDVIEPSDFEYDVVIDHPEELAALTELVRSRLAEVEHTRTGAATPGPPRQFKLGTRRGQFVRSTLSLAQLSGRPLQLTGQGLFTGRKVKGPLKACADACAQIAGGRVRIDPDQRLLEYQPGPRVVDGHSVCELDSNESVSILVVTLLPLAVGDPRSFQFELRGATELEFSSPADYYRNVLFPLLQRLGIDLALDIQARGFYGGAPGRVCLNVTGTAALQPLEMLDKGEPCEIQLSVHTGGAAEVDETELVRETEKFCRDLGFEGRFHATWSRQEAADSRGLSASFALRTEYSILGADIACDVIGGADDLAHAMSSLRRRIGRLFESSAPLDLFTADKILLYLALAGGAVALPVEDDMEHIYTQLSLLNSVHPGRIRVSSERQRIIVEMERLEL